MSKIWKILVGLIAIIIVLALGVGGWVYTQLQPVDPQKVEKVSFVVPRGQSTTQIGYRLQEAGLLKNSLLFRFVVKQQNLAGKIQAGTFAISPSMNPMEIAQALTQGTNDTWVKVLEGWRVEEVADAFAEADLPAFNRDEFLSLAKDEEGYLFPDSYLVPKDSTAVTIHELLRDTFDKKVVKGLESEIAASGHSLKDVVIMASLVQREAKGEDQMRMVAGILWNRIGGHIGLNVDATLQYIRGYDPIEQTWWASPRVVDKASTSSFNTYKYVGLPPRPIANPGLEAIQAVLEPTITDNLFYMHDARGGVHYARTLDEHNRNVQMYLR
jgi:UPF0755 protein